MRHSETFDTVPGETADYADDTDCSEGRFLIPHLRNLRHLRLPPDSGFCRHPHYTPWGGGKSSVLDIFMKNNLTLSQLLSDSKVPAEENPVSRAMKRLLLIIPIPLAH